MSVVDQGGNIRWGKLFLWCLIIIVAVTAIGVFAKYLGLYEGYLSKPAEILDVDNVEAEFEWFYSYKTALEAGRANIASSQSRLDAIVELNGDDRSKWPMASRDEYQQYLDLRSQSEIAYNGKCAQYQAKWDNVFHSIVAPMDIPRDCEMIQ